MRRWWILAAMALPAFLLNIDFYGISVALPAIGEALGAGTTALQWAVNGFNLALIAPLIAFGRLGDLVGRRRLLLVGVVLFALGSAMCGFATDMGMLIAGRCVQGLAVALFSTSPLSIVGDVFPEDRHALAFSIWAAIGAAGSAVGPLVGGALTELFGWRWFFFINLPVAALTIVLVLAIVPESKDETARGRLRPPGLHRDHPGSRGPGLWPAGGRRCRLDRRWPCWARFWPARPCLLLAATDRAPRASSRCSSPVCSVCPAICRARGRGRREFRLQRGHLLLGPLPAGPARPGAAAGRLGDARLLRLLRRHAAAGRQPHAARRAARTDGRRHGADGGGQPAVPAGRPRLAGARRSASRGSAKASPSTPRPPPRWTPCPVTVRRRIRRAERRAPARLDPGHRRGRARVPDPRKPRPARRPCAAHGELDAQQAALVRALYSGSTAARSTLAGLAPALHAEIAGVDDQPCSTRRSAARCWPVPSSRWRGCRSRSGCRQGSRLPRR